ncbi:hypothetical protein TNCT_692421 [Trichonephila clavata]|uniref:Uncharacterized protein n=1 Tax=Trichonephila clavata TaxID=2740835 RepID=A0A8X6JJH2_TRICU|nr:hypothetical protein TNCT_692421 [Trichonephila clavata]
MPLNPVFCLHFPCVRPLSLSAFLIGDLSIHYSAARLEVPKKIDEPEFVPLSQFLETLVARLCTCSAEPSRIFDEAQQNYRNRPFSLRVL